jgi:hypothetical protein
MNLSEVKNRREIRALSLPELIVGLFLFTIAIFPLFGIIPTAYMSIKKAEDFSAASCYAQELIEIYRLTDPHLMVSDSPHTTNLDVKLNGTDYKVLLDIYNMDGNSPAKLVDVTVNMYWKRIPEHISVYSRVYYNE